MRVKVKLIGIARDVFGPTADVVVGEGATVKDVITELVRRHRGKLSGREREYATKFLNRSRIILNEEYSDVSAKVRDGDVITLITLAAGG